VLGERTNNNTDAEGVAVQMQHWEKEPTTSHMQRKVQCKCSARRKVQQQHRCQGSCRTDATVAVVEPWAIVQDAVVQRMLGREA